MPVTWQFTPPRMNAALTLHLAAEAAAEAGAAVLLNASRPLVPVDSGDLRDSGRIEHTESGAAVVYTGIADDGFDYGVKVHEDLELNHPNGGQAKFLEQPMHAEHAAVGAATAEILRAALAR